MNTLGHQLPWPLVPFSALWSALGAIAAMRDVIEHHYRDPWEWDDGLMGRAEARLARWRGHTGPTSDATMAAVRAALDDDLDTPTVFRVIDAAVAQGDGAGDAARLLGVDL